VLVHIGRHTFAELLFGSHDPLDRALLHIEGAAADVPVPQPADLNRSLAIGALYASPVRLSTRRLHLL
jgi:hypothetical protein